MLRKPVNALYDILKSFVCTHGYATDQVLRPKSPETDVIVLHWVLDASGSKV